MAGPQYPPGFFHEMAETGNFGPLMSALLPRQRAFVIAYYTAGTGDARAAALAAGYASKSDVSLRVQAHNTLHNPKVQGAMHEFGRSRLQANAPAYLKELHYLATDRKAAKPEVRLKAALGGLNRAGFGAEVNVNQNTNITVTYEERVSRLRQLAALAGDDPDKAIEGLAAPSETSLPSVSDAEWEDVA